MKAEGVIEGGAGGSGARQQDQSVGTSEGRELKPGEEEAEQQKFVWQYDVLPSITASQYHNYLTVGAVICCACCCCCSAWLALVQGMSRARAHMRSP